MATEQLHIPQSLGNYLMQSGPKTAWVPEAITCHHGKISIQLLINKIHDSTSASRSGKRCHELEGACQSEGRKHPEILISSLEAGHAPPFALRACQTRVLKTEWSLPSDYILDFQKMCGVRMNSAPWAHPGWAAWGCMPAHVCTRLHPQPPPRDKCRQHSAHTAHGCARSSGSGDHTLRAPNSEATGVTIHRVWQKQAHGGG